MTQAASPKARRRPPGAGAEAAEVSGVAVEVGEGGDSSWSLMADFPSLNRIVKDTMSTATSSSSFILKLNFLFSFMIQGLERRGLRRWSMIDSIAVSVFADIFIELANTETAATTLWERVQNL